MDPVLLYISAASDLEAEREVLGRAVAEIPLDVGWRIVQSPTRGEPADPEAVQRADVHLLLLGGDIRAPIGLEWLTAWRAGRRPLLWLKGGVPRTLAAQEFVRFVERQATWRPFKDAAELRRQTLTMLVDHLLGRAGELALSAAELERLQSWRAELAGPAGAVDDETRGGAGDSSVILTAARYLPSEGVLIQPPEPDRDPGTA